MAKFIPGAEFALLQAQRIKELEAYAQRCYNTLKFIGQSTKEADTRKRAYATLETEPAKKTCTRSHPHEEMDDYCQTMTWIERAAAAMRSQPDRDSSGESQHG
jgi:hypothetical protein